MKIKILISLLLIFNITRSQIKEEVNIEINNNEKLFGSLLIPDSHNKIIILIISGSGSTDRNGNGPLTKNNSLKMLAEKLYENGISSLRYDKRGVGKSTIKDFNEREIEFEDYIKDANKWIDFLKNDNRFNNIYVLGHSEGSLIGIISSNKKDIKGFISISGSGYTASEIILKQLKNQPDIVKKESKEIINSLNKGITYLNVPEYLMALFRPSVQPYLISWFKYDPINEINKLNIPTLIIQGNKDLQVETDNADLLNSNSINSNLFIIDNMNHVLKNTPSKEKNIRSYNDPNIELHEKLIPIILSFVKNS